jgi:hypothetical protein
MSSFIRQLERVLNSHQPIDHEDLVVVIQPKYLQLSFLLVICF